MNTSESVDSIIIKKNGDIQEKNVKLNELYKSCNFKISKSFEKQHEYNYNNKIYEVYGKKNGKANTENKYDFPPPIDNTLFFGNMCILAKLDNEYEKLTKNEWNTVYEKLFGGFHDLDSHDETRSIDSEIYDSDEYTNEGYHKDGFIVDDKELEEEDYI